jgi:hypothetical protein
MYKMVINRTDGTVCSVEDSSIVDIDNLDSEGFALLSAWIESGADSVSTEIAEKYGTPLEKFVNNDLSHANTMAFSAKALRDEINERLNCGYEQKEYQFAKEFTDAQLENLGQYILSSDYLWNVYSEELLSGIRNYASDIMGRKIS